ncbi:MAG: NAD-dependent epimerase/dehydratase family protein [Cohaesibacter sp.]|nr:NAD-dependent epimerase/dehydratase family protein [Cohaesibacter sp.]MCV6603029.1 NAD-dependent epimerase/dehydratase family protein [Cohaesibacter sp.]
MRIFITGATGLIGSATLKALLTKGHDVTALARSDEKAKQLSNMGATPIRGDLTDPAPWIPIALEHDGIIHAAATFDASMGETDIAMVKSLVEQAKAMPPDNKINLIYTGGCWLYPESPVIPLTERHVLDPLPAFEWMLDSIEHLHACPTFHLTVIHPAIVIAKDRGLICNWIRQARKDEDMSVIDSLGIHYPLIHADDLADLYRRAIEAGQSGLLLNASGFKSASLQEITQMIASKTGKAHRIKIQPLEEAIEQKGDWAAGFGRSQRMEADRAKDSLGWQPVFDDLEKLVTDCLD